MTIERDKKGRFVKGGTKNPKSYIWTKYDYPSKKGFTKENNEGVKRQAEKLRGRPNPNRSRLNKINPPHKGHPHTEKTKKLIREKRKLQVMKRGKEHHLWIADRGLLRYSEKWTEELRQKIRRRDKLICQVCNNKNKKLKETLSVHHIDYNKLNCVDNNLISLCRCCHRTLHAEKRKEYWIWQLQVFMNLFHGADNKLFGNSNVKR